MFIKYTEINVETSSQFYEIETKIISGFGTIEVILIYCLTRIHHLRIYFNCQLKQSINFNLNVHSNFLLHCVPQQYKYISRTHVVNLSTF